MLHQPTIEKLLAMRMEPIVECWRSFEQDENAQPLSFEEKLSLMVDRLWTWRQNMALQRRLRYAKLKGNACVEDIDYRAARGLDRNLMRSLRRGDFALQGRLDLHGMTQAQAKEAVDRFLSDSRRSGKRCVLIVHGRGLNSQDQIPVLKQQVKGWLSQKRLGSMVLAFATARPQDGGAGAVYVLLRR